MAFNKSVLTLPQQFFSLKNLIILSNMPFFFPSEFYLPLKTFSERALSNAREVSDTHKIKNPK